MGVGVRHRDIDRLAVVAVVNPHAAFVDRVVAVPPPSRNIEVINWTIRSSRAYKR